MLSGLSPLRPWPKVGALGIAWLCLAQISWAQHWRPYIEHHATHFAPIGYLDGFEEMAYSVWAFDSTIGPTEATFRFQPMLQRCLPCDSIAQDTNLYLQGPSLLGDSVIVGHDTSWFYGHGQSWVVPHVLAKDSYWIWKPGVTASVDSLWAATVLGQSDSLMRILLSNGDTFLLSRSYGFTRLPDSLGQTHVMVGIQGEKRLNPTPHNLGGQLPTTERMFALPKGTRLVYRDYSAAFLPNFPFEEWETIFSITMLSDPVYWADTILFHYRVATGNPCSGCGYTTSDFTLNILTLGRTQTAGRNYIYKPTKDDLLLESKYNISNVPMFSPPPYDQVDPASPFIENTSFLPGVLAPWNCTAPSTFSTGEAGMRHLYDQDPQWGTSISSYYVSGVSQAFREITNVDTQLFKACIPYPSSVFDEFGYQLADSIGLTYLYEALPELVSLDELLSYEYPDGRIIGPSIPDTLLGTYYTISTPEPNRQPAAAIKVYPNPFGSKLHLSTSAGAIQHVEMYDVTGRLQLTQPVNATEITLATEALPAGVYILHAITASGSVTTHRLVKW